MSSTRAYRKRKWCVCVCVPQVELNRQWGVNEPRDRAQRWADVFEDAGYAPLFLSTGVAYLGARVTFGVWPAALKPNGVNGVADAGRGNETWWNLTALRGPLNLRARESAIYDFRDPRMTIGINSSRWSAVLEEIHRIVGTAGRGRV